VYHAKSQTSGKINFMKLPLQAVLLFINVHIIIIVRADQSGDFAATKIKNYTFETFIDSKAKKFEVHVNGRGTGC